MGKEIKTVAVLGTTSWGLTLANLLSKAEGCSVRAWARTAAEADRLSAGHMVRDWIPALKGVSFLSSPAEAFEGADLVIICVPSKDVARNLAVTREYLAPHTLVLCASKGIEADGYGLMSDVITRELPQIPADQIGVISGPNLAREVAEGAVACTTVAFTDLAHAQAVQQRFGMPGFRVYATQDLIGVQIGGTYKHIMAMSAGFIDALSVGNNAKAALLTRGLHEMTNYGVAKGGLRETFAGLSGLGDLLASCYSSLSRNYQLGFKVGNCMSVEEAIESIDGVIEGVETVRAIVNDARRLRLELPIAETVYGVIHEGLDTLSIAADLLNRELKREADLSAHMDTK